MSVLAIALYDIKAKVIFKFEFNALFILPNQSDNLYEIKNISPPTTNPRPSRFIIIHSVIGKVQRIISAIINKKRKRDKYFSLLLWRESSKEI